MEKWQKITVKALNKEDIKEKYGFIIFLDALGVRNMTNDETKEFIKAFNKLVEVTLHNMKDHIESLFSHLNFLQLESTPQVSHFIFQDSAIITFEFKKEYLSVGVSLIYFIHEFISHFFILGLINKIAFRGALSLGNFIEYKGQCILGEAVYDAAKYHDHAQLLSIIVTPKTSKLECPHFFGQ